MAIVVIKAKMAVRLSQSGRDEIRFELHQLRPSEPLNGLVRRGVKPIRDRLACGIPGRRTAIPDDTVSTVRTGAAKAEARRVRPK